MVITTHSHTKEEMKEVVEEVAGKAPLQGIIKETVIIKINTTIADITVVVVTNNNIGEIELYTCC